MQPVKNLSMLAQATFVSLLRFSLKRSSVADLSLALLQRTPFPTFMYWKSQRSKFHNPYCLVNLIYHSLSDYIHLKQNLTICRLNLLLFLDDAGRIDFPSSARTLSLFLYSDLLSTVHTSSPSEPHPHLTFISYDRLSCSSSDEEEMLSLLSSAACFSR